MQINLTSDQADTLRDVISDGEAPALVLNVGEGHSGFGLYAWEEDYPEEGATLIAPMEALTGAQPAPAAPSEQRRALPNPGSPEASAMLDSLLAAPTAQPADSAMEVLHQAKEALRGAETWLEGWASAEPYLSEIRRALAAFDALQQDKP